MGKCILEIRLYIRRSLDYVNVTVHELGYSIQYFDMSTDPLVVGRKSFIVERFGAVDVKKFQGWGKLALPDAGVRGVLC